MSEQDDAGTSHDVLIHARAQDLAHKWAENLGPDEEAFWRVNGTPRQTDPGSRVWFEDNGTIYAWGEITALEDGRLWFDGARRTDVPCIDDAPTRGFTYVEPLIQRLQDADSEVFTRAE